MQFHGKIILYQTFKEDILNGKLCNVGIDISRSSHTLCGAEDGVAQCPNVGDLDNSWSEPFLLLGHVPSDQRLTEKVRQKRHGHF